MSQWNVWQTFTGIYFPKHCWDSFVKTPGVYFTLEIVNETFTTNICGGVFRFHFQEITVKQGGERAKTCRSILATTYIWYLMQSFALPRLIHASIWFVVPQYHCTLLHWTTLKFNTTICTAVYFTKVHCSIIHSTLHYTTLHYTTLHYDLSWCSTVVKWRISLIEEGGYWLPFIHFTSNENNLIV